MNKIIKVLLIGTEPSDFYNNIASHVNKNTEIQMDILEFRLNSRGNLKDYYTQVHPNIQSKGKYRTISHLFKSLFNKIFYQIFWEQKSLKQAIKVSSLYHDISSLFLQYDILNFQCIDKRNLFYYNFIQPKNKVITTFWGTDLHNNNKEFKQLQRFYIKKSHLFTMQTTDMKADFIETFGINYKEKINIVHSGIDDSLFNLFEEQLPYKIELKNYFLKNNQLKEDNIIITVGYSADPNCNHLNIINQLAQLNEDIKQKIILFFPLTYGGKEDYKNSIKQLCNEKKITTFFFEKFLTIGELIKLRMTSDIYLHFLNADALSASLSEYLFSNNLAIISDNLPYSTFKENNVFYKSANLKALNTVLLDSILNLNEYGQKMKDNHRIIRNLLSDKGQINKWISIYRNITNEQLH